MRVDSASTAPLVTEPDALPNGFTLHDWTALPLETRVSCLLFDALAEIALDLALTKALLCAGWSRIFDCCLTNVEKALERLSS